MTIREAAARLGVSPGRVRHYIGDGRLAATALHPRMLLLRPEDVEAFALRPRRPGRPRRLPPAPEEAPRDHR